MRRFSSSLLHGSSALPEGLTEYLLNISDLT